MDLATTPPVLLRTNIAWKGAADPYERRRIHEGKARDTYGSAKTGDHIVVTSDRISAFDAKMPFGIPNKGAILNMLSAHFMRMAEERGIKTWMFERGVPHPNVTIGRSCTPFKIEMIVRGYLCGTAWRAYKKGIRLICGAELPDGLKENDRLPAPIITPTTKADIGKHDEDITPEAIVASGLCTQAQYDELARISLELYQMGSEAAAKGALLLADTKFEFGLFEGEILLIDELLTPDSSRYFDKYYYEDRQPKGEAQADLSKEYFRKLLMSRGFNGGEGQVIPEISPTEIDEIASRYETVYHRLVGYPLFPMVPENDTYGLLHFNLSSTEEAVEDGINRWFQEHRSVH